MTETPPCRAFPEGASRKLIGLWCPLCTTWRCWRRYLSWEKSMGITLNEKDHPAELDADHHPTAIRTQT